MFTHRNLIGRTFHKLSVIEFSHTKKGKTHWRCLCECGNEKIIDSSSLSSGHTKSCGCQRTLSNYKKMRDLSGKRFGKLLVLEFSHKDSKNIYWKCQCDCGRIINSPSSTNLFRGGATSCGCIRLEKVRNMALSMTKNANPMWKGGISKQKYPDIWNDELKESIRNRDERQCRFPNCECTDIGLKRRLDVHHIDSDKNNCSSYNLISLCIAHHRMVELSPIHWMEYFYAITMDYKA